MHLHAFWHQAQQTLRTQARVRVRQCHAPERGVASNALYLRKRTFLAVAAPEGVAVAATSQPHDLPELPQALPRHRRVALPTHEQVKTERDNLARRKAWRKALRGTIYTLVVVAALAVLIATLFLPVLQISGSSMEPTLQDGDVVVLLKTGTYEQGDLCSFAYENKYLIKRIVGLPGDWVQIDADGVVYVNGTQLDEPYVAEQSLGECDIEFPFQVPDGQYFVLGDHRATSIDSRSTVIGCVTQDQIVGHVTLRVWPLNKLAVIE